MPYLKRNMACEIETTVSQDQCQKTRSDDGTIRLEKSKYLETSAHRLFLSDPLFAHTPVRKAGSVSGGLVEDFDLSRLGLQRQTAKDMGVVAVVAMGWNICNSWAAVAATLAISIGSGGSVTLLYGIVIIFVLGLACALSMAEIASVYRPRAGSTITQAS
jgi:hypothetical protein